jgi:hypothetical protein
MGMNKGYENMTEKIKELSLKQRAITERNQETRIQDNKELLRRKAGMTTGSRK